MRTEEYERWVRRLVQYDPASAAAGSPRDIAYLEMVEAGVPLKDRVAISMDAGNLWYRREEAVVAAVERLRAADLEFATRPWRRGLPRYGGNLANDTAQRAAGKAPELAMGYCGDTVQYGRSLVEKSARLAASYGHGFIKADQFPHWLYAFNGTTDYIDVNNNSEGEKGMDKKIDWSKPLWAFKTPGHEVVDAKVYTYKSGRQRVVWVDERVYPVDDQGRAVANVDYGLNWVKKGHQIVENVPEEKFFVGLYRLGNGRYEITDCGQTTTMGVLNSWKRLMADQPHWIVDTRKSAAQPDPVKHDPTDYVVIYYGDEDETATCVNRLLTQKKAKALCGSTDTIVRVRTTPPPVDTSRYIQLYRRAGTNEAWRINALDGRQEFTWEGADKKSGWNEYVNVKVRD